MFLKILVTLISIFNVIYADSIPDNSHSASKSVYISNINNDQNLSIVGCIESMFGNSGCFKVVENQAMYAGYKFNILRLFAIKTELLDSQDTLSVGNYDFSPNVVSDRLFQISKDIDAPAFHFSGSIYVDNAYADMISEKYYHEIYLDENNTIHIKLKKRVVGFSDGTEETINYH